MIIVLYIILGVCFATMVFCIYMLRRNFQVRDLRTELLYEERAYPNCDYRRYDSLPSYDSMLLHFWKPLSSYRKDLPPLSTIYK
jgi:hypothetical protein